MRIAQGGRRSQAKQEKENFNTLFYILLCDTFFNTIHL